VKYPKLLKIEITRMCNARCVFCDHDPRCTDTMDVGTFRRIIKDFPEADVIQPQWYGEPMMHPDFKEIVKICKKSGKKISFYTNGSLIHRHIDALKLLGKEDRIKISVEGDNKEAYEKIRPPLKWDRLIKNVKMLRKANPKVKVQARITICPEIEGREEENRKFWRKMTGRKVQMVSEKPVKREIKGSYTVPESCFQTLEYFVVKADGDITLCCIDYQGGVTLGNIEKGPRKEWERTYGLRHCDYEMCGTCIRRFKPE